MPSSKQRLEVWHGIREKTSGGLRKSDLVKNKRGKIVSKRKSGQAHDQNNLKGFLREKGKSVPKDAMLYKKGANKSVKVLAVKKEPPKIAAKKPAAPKVKPAAPKKPVVKKVVKAAPAPKKAAPKKIPKKRKLASKKKKAYPPGINPITRQPYAKKSKSGYVSKGAIHIDNIVPKKQKPKAPKKKTKEEFDAEVAQMMQLGMSEF